MNKYYSIPMAVSLTISWGSDPQNIVFFFLSFYKESTLQNHTLTPRDEGYKVIMEDRWAYGQMDGLDFVKGPDPGWGGRAKWSQRDF